MSNITQRWVEVLKPFSGEYSKKLTASEIARKTKIPQQTANRILNNLVKRNLINYEKQGRNKLFYFNLKKEQAKILFNIVESKKALDFLIKNKKQGTIIADLLKNCESLILFGSYALDKFDEKSDLDLIIFKAKKRFKEKINLFPIRIHPHFTDFKNFEKLIKGKNPLALEIVKNHIIFGDVSRIIKIFAKNE